MKKKFLSRKLAAGTLSVLMALSSFSGSIPVRAEETSASSSSVSTEISSSSVSSVSSASSSVVEETKNEAKEEVKQEEAKTEAEKTEEIKASSSEKKADEQKAPEVKQEEKKEEQKQEEVKTEEKKESSDDVYRILVDAKESVIREDDEVLSEYDGVYLLQYDSKSDAKDAYKYYEKKANAVDMDAVLSIASGADTPALAVTPDIDPFQEAQDQNSIKSAKGAIAMIDTGASVSGNIKSAVSVIGDDASDGNGHGSWMAKNIASVNPDANILSIKALDDKGRGSIATVYAAIKYAMEQKVSIINLSLSGYMTAESDILSAAIRDASKAGITVVGAAGNNGADVKDFVPGNISEALIVGACDANGKRIATSNYGETVDYFVKADTTSAAAAKMSGFVSLGVEVKADGKLVFDTVVKEKKEVETKPISVYMEFMDDGLDKGRFLDAYGATVHAFVEDGWIRVLVNEDPENFDLNSLAGPQVIINDAQSGGKTKYITDECHYDERLGYMYIPDKYKDELLAIRTHLLAKGPVWEYYVPEIIRGTGTSEATPTFGDKYEERVERIKNSGDLYGADNSAFFKNRTWENWENETWQSLYAGSNSVTTTEDMTVFKGLKKNTWYHLSNGLVTEIGTGAGSGHADEERQNAINTGTLDSFSKIKGAFAGTQHGMAVSIWNFSNSEKIDDYSFGTLSDSQISDLNAIFGKTGIGAPGKGQSAMTQGGTSNSHVQYSGHNWLYGICVEDQASNHNDEMIFGKYAEVKIFSVTESNNKITAIGAFHVNTKGFTSNGVPTGAQEVGGMFKITGPVVQEGKAYIQKKSANTSITLNNSNYSLKGAVYTLYSDSACTKVVKDGSSNVTFTTDANGKSNTVTLEAGTYYAKETKAPAGYKLNTKAIKLIVKKGETEVGETEDEPVSGEMPISVVKVGKDGEPWKTEDLPGETSLSGAEFTFKHYDKKGGTLLHTWTFKTDAKGQVQFGDHVFPLGYYVINETKAPTGFKVSSKQSVVTLTENASTKTVKPVENYADDSITIPEEYDLGGFEIEKQDIELNKNEAISGGSFAGINFEITNKSSKSIEWGGKSYAAGDVITTISTDETGHCKIEGLQYGTYGYRELPKEEESKDANNSYLVSVTDEKTVKVDSGNIKKVVVKDQIKRADFKFVKTGNRDIPLKGIPFVVEQVDTGEKHVIVTGENGVFDSSAIAHTQDTNALDGVLENYNEETGAEIPDDAQFGTWFGLGQNKSEATAKDDLGALPYGSYKMSELRCNANEGYELVKDFEFSVFGDTELDFGVIENHQGEVDIHTVALDDATKDHISSIAEDGFIHLTDTVTMKGLIKGETYILRATLMNCADEEAPAEEAGDTSEASEGSSEDGDGAVAEPSDLEETLAENEEGLVESVTGYKEFVADATNMDVEVPLGKFKSVPGKTVVYEKLFLITKNDQPGEEIAQHEDPDDEDQIVTIPEVKTTAVSEDTDKHFAPSKKEAVIFDEAAFKGLIPEKEYTIEGTLVSKITEQPITDSEGNEIKGVLVSVDGEDVEEGNVFVPKNADGVAVLKFTFDSSLLEGDTVVVYEAISYKDAEVAVHRDLTSEDQSVDVPKIGTTAKDSETNANISNPDEKVTLIDTVEYVGLDTESEYVVTGKLVDKDGKPILVKGKEVTAESEKFTPESKDGSVEVKFEFNGSDLGGKDVVAFETLYFVKGEDLLEIAKHEDPADENQTVHFPEVGTTATDGKTGDHVGTVGKTETVVDVVAYKNLIPGKKYKVTGTLVDKSTKKEIGVKAESEVFEVKEGKTSGSVKVTFKVDSSVLAGKTVVAYEKLFYEDKEIAVHADITDKEQTIFYPSVRTSAKDADTKSRTGNDNSKKIIDTVTLKNLIVGEKYQVSGRLMDKTNKKVLGITAKSKVFTAQKANDTVEIEFAVDGSKLGTVVVFEDLIHVSNKKETVVAKHEDYEDTAQTVTYKHASKKTTVTPKTPTSTSSRAKNAKTGDTNHVVLLAVILAAAIAGIAVVVIRKRRKA